MNVYIERELKGETFALLSNQHSNWQLCMIIPLFGLPLTRPQSVSWSLLWELIKENLDPPELAANDFGEGVSGSERASHVVSQNTKGLSPATLSLTSCSNVGDCFQMHSELDWPNVCPSIQEAQ